MEYGAPLRRVPRCRGAQGGAVYGGGDGFAFPCGQAKGGLPTGKPRPLRPGVDLSSTKKKESDNLVPTGRNSCRRPAKVIAVDQTMGLDVLDCPRCHGRMELISAIQDPLVALRDGFWTTSALE